MEKYYYSFITDDLYFDPDEDVSVLIEPADSICGREAWKVSGTFDQLNEFFNDPYTWSYSIDEDMMDHFIEDVRNSEFRDSLDDILHERETVLLG